MPMGSIILKPGVNAEQTQTFNEAGIYRSQLLRYKDGLIQTIGGWEQLVTLASTIEGSSTLAATSPSTVRDLHAWQDIQGIDWLVAGAMANLTVYQASATQDISPATLTTSNTPNFSTINGSCQITVIDSGSGPTQYNTVFFNTPIAIANLLLNTAYDIITVLSSQSYIINSSVVANATVNNNGLLPVFSTTLDSAAVSVALANHNFQSVLGLQQSFRAPTTVGGLTIEGPYNITSVVTSTNFIITEEAAATATASSTMNAGLAQLFYFVTLGPQVAGLGFGGGGFGLGGFGVGATVIGAVGSPITVTNWSMVNWGEILLACPYDGPVFSWSPHSGFSNAQVVSEAPFFNGGIFISMPQQILVCWKSVQSTGTQDNLVVRWSDEGDYTVWDVTNQTSAGSFHIPTGSVIVGGLQAPSYAVVWTDVDAWIMQYVGGDVIFNFTKAGTGCGLIGQHAADVINNEVYWCGKSNFYKLGDRGVQPLPCSVWDFIFQNINETHAHKTICAPNSAFNEVEWFFPSTNSTECDSYVKLNLIENSWDCGSLSRTAWIDISVLGNPIGADPLGDLWQHEEGESTPGTPTSFFESGWWSIADGNEFAFVDYVIPDFRWSTYSGASDASIMVTFSSINYPGDTPRLYGPFTVTQSTQYINPRIRGRSMAVLVQSANDVFWRIGRIRYRYSSAGRR